MIFPVLQRWNHRFFFEYLCKISLVIIADLLTDFRNRGIGIRKQSFCFFNSHVSDVFGKGKAGFFFEQVGNVPFTDMKHICDCLTADWFIQVDVYKRQEWGRTANAGDSACVDV